MGQIGRLNLVPVRLVNAQRTIGCHQIGVHPVGPSRVDSHPGRNRADMTELFRIRATAAQQGNQGVMGVHPHILSPGEKLPDGQVGTFIGFGQHQDPAHV
jgi:hypothetical protein